MAATLWLVCAPDLYRRLAQAVLQSFQDSLGVARVLALMAVGLGVWMVYVGIYVV